MPQRMSDHVHEPAEQLTRAVELLAGLQKQVPADTAAAQYCRVALATLGHLENAMRVANLIPSPARQGSYPQSGGG